MPLHRNIPTCTARSKRSKCRCKNLPIAGSDKCRMHGGASPKGFESPKFVHGLRSKYLKHLPSAQQIQFDEYDERDKEASIYDEIRIQEIQLGQILEMQNDSTLFENWRSIRRLCEKLEEVILNPPDEGDEGFEFEDTPEMILQDIGVLFKHVDVSLKTFDEINDRIERLRKLQETNSKIKKEVLDREVERKKLVPIEAFHKFAMEAGKQFELSPDNIRTMQLHGLAAAFNALPPVIRDAPKQITAGE